MRPWEAEPLLNDGHGYPTEEGLEALREWSGTPHELVDLLSATFGRMGTVQEVVETEAFLNRRVHVVRLATGGWSGNESMISAIRKSWFWFRYWESSHRGGGFIFHVPVDRWDQEMPVMPRAVNEGDQLAR